MSGAVSGVSGASPIWNKVIKFALDKSEKGTYDKDDDGHAWPLQPEEVVGASICADTGDIRPDCQTRFEYFLSGTVPSSGIVTNQDLMIFRDTGQVAGKDALPEQVESQNKPVYIDPVGGIYCMNCPIASTSATIRYPLVLKGQTFNYGNLGSAQYKLVPFYILTKYKLVLKCII